MGQMVTPEYLINKLKETGFCLNGSIENEIDATLKFCHENFKKFS
jgi:hypothetical protein